MPQCLHFFASRRISSAHSGHLRSSWVSGAPADFERDGSIMRSRKASSGLITIESRNQPGPWRPRPAAPTATTTENTSQNMKNVNSIDDPLGAPSRMIGRAAI